jgi:hypothetical protein
MAFPELLRMLFENNGAGPKLREDILPVSVAGKVFSETAPENTGVFWIKTPDYALHVHNGTDWVPLTAVYEEDAGVPENTGGD